MTWDTHVAATLPRRWPGIPRTADMGSPRSVIARLRRAQITVICAVTAVAKPIPISSFLRALSPIPRVLRYAAMLTGPHAFGAHRARYE
jgi:hypothetical protein